MMICATIAIVFAANAALGAAAHGKGRLVLPHPAVAAGSALHVEGVEFEPGAYHLHLRGTLARYELPRVEIGEAGTFSLAWDVPADARPGAYRLVVVAPDGDEVTNADVAITPLGPGPAASEERLGHEAPTAARADAMPLERSRSAAEWVVILLAIAGSGALGAALLRRGGAG